ncbi:MAG: DUF2778 domain-containing protein [Hyphomicrobium sp.]
MAAAVVMLAFSAAYSHAQQSVAPDAPTVAPAPTPASPPTAADQIADIFSKVGDDIYHECIFELSEEQVEVQSALMQAYAKQGASNVIARRLAAQQIRPPELSDKCRELRSQPEVAPSTWDTAVQIDKQPASPKPKPVVRPAPEAFNAKLALAAKKGLPQWDCAPGVDFVTIELNGFKRKLTGGEICNPYQDIVREAPASLRSFRLGYTIATGRLFIIADGAEGNGQTIAWAISGRDVCRNNPDADCLASRAVGSLPPGEYSFAAEKSQRINFGPKTKRNVAGIYLNKLWNTDRFSAAQVAAIRARGNIAIHMRLKGEMSEACIGLEPKGWDYVASLIKAGRAAGVNVYLDEPYPKIAEAPPVIVASSFSLTSLFGN